MTFEEILDHPLDMPQRRGRISYRALKRQFALDDAYLDDLKADCAPCPMASMAITTATPMITPSIVNVERRGFAVRPGAQYAWP